MSAVRKDSFNQQRDQPVTQCRWAIYLYLALPIYLTSYHFRFPYPVLQVFAAALPVEEAEGAKEEDQPMAEGKKQKVEKRKEDLVVQREKTSKVSSEKASEKKTDDHNHNTKKNSNSIITIENIRQRKVFLFVATDIRIKNETTTKEVLSIWLAKTYIPHCVAIKTDRKLQPKYGRNKTLKLITKTCHKSRKVGKQIFASTRVQPFPICERFRPWNKK